MKKVVVAVVLAALLAPVSAFAGGTPCSGKKGGIARCDNGKFVCQDGSFSASKKQCSADMIGKGQSQPKEAAKPPAAAKDAGVKAPDAKGADSKAAAPVKPAEPVKK